MTVLVLLVCCVSPEPAGAADGPDALALAERHAPVVMVRTQPRACGEGEPYRPTAVESVLGRADVVLRGPDGEAITAPTAADLYGRGPGWHLDLPGTALRPGCGYERWSRANGADRAPLGPVVYARVATDPDEPGWIVLQYWLYWVFNDWNDRHESDWEMIQLHFEAGTVAEALTVEPAFAVYAQHEGAEVGEWGSTKVGKVDGTRPVVHSSMGSHASYFSARRWFGKGASTGFGCDDSRLPSTRLDPAVVLLPDEVSGPDDPFAWVAYTGRWGEAHAGFNNGPTGPIGKAQWSNPVSWAEEHAREGSVALPELGTNVTDFFCAASRESSRLLVDFLDEPVAMSALTMGFAAVGIVAARRTRWRPGDPLPIAARRRVGQILNSSIRLLARESRLLVGLGSVLVAGGAVATALQLLVLEVTPAGDLADVVDEQSSLGVPIAHLIGALVTVPTMCLVGAALMVAVRELEQGRRPQPGAALRAAFRPVSGTSAALVLVVTASVALSSVVLVPIGLWLIARWALAAPACVVEGLSVRDGLRRSAQLSRGRRLGVLAVGVVALGAAAVAGPLVGTIVLLASDASIVAVNVISALVGTITVPIAAVAISLLYYDRRTAHAGEPSPPG